MDDYDIVHTITDWYDGARGGVADVLGEPHYYENRWNEGEDNWSEIYFLKPLDEETFGLALEDWAIWLRWETAFISGQTNQDSHPALAEDRGRHEELKRILSDRLVIDEASALHARAEFLYGQPARVRWKIIIANEEAHPVR